MNKSPIIEPNPNENTPYQVLCLDGGGIRGIFLATLLAKIEDDCSVRIADHFDLIVGTSTGGIIAIGLGLGLSPQEILALYTENGDQIFRSALPKALRKYRLASYLDLYNWRQIYRRKFSNKALEDILRSVMGDKLLGHSTKRLVIPSYDLDEGKIKLFKTAHHSRFRRDYKWPAWQVAMATSAAPTYFPAFRGNDARTFVDGGLWAADPTLVGITEALGVLNKNPEDINVLSIGTLLEIGTDNPWLNWAGKLSWGVSVPRILMEAQSQAAQGQSRILLGWDRVFRINPPVPRGKFTMDNAAFSRELLAKAEHHVEHALPEIEKRFLNHRAAKFTPEYEVAPNARD